MCKSVNSFLYKVFALIIFHVVILTGVCVAQASSAAIKGYTKYYLKGEFQKAHEQFKDALVENEDDVIANFGLALLFSNKSYKDELFKAFQRIRRAREEVDKLNAAQLGLISKEIKEIPDIKGEIGKEYTDIEKKLYESIVAVPTIKQAERFVNEFPDSKYMIEIMQIRNNEVFKKAKEENTLVAYNMFIERFPDAIALPEAVRLRNEVAYKDLITAPDVNKTYDYLNRYPNSELAAKVIILRDSLEYENTKRINTSEAFGSFIERYPRSRQIDHAIDQYIILEFSKAQARKSPKDYQEFINRYYSSEKGQMAVGLRDQETVAELEKKNTVTAYNNYISLFQAYALKTKEIINLRNKKAFEDALESNTIDAFEDFVYNYPAAPQVKEAMEKRDTLIIDSCRSLDTEYNVLSFLRPYPKLQKSPQGLLVLEQAAFKEAEKDNTKESYDAFLKNYPLSSLIKKATEKRDRIK